METFRVQGTAKSRAPGKRLAAIAGVNASGNLEVLVERTLPDNQCSVEVATAANGFRDLWQAVIAEFFERSSPGGLRFSINDTGARPETVTLRLMQGMRLMEVEQ
jgi:malonate decarboxylase delta subunit